MADEKMGLADFLAKYPELAEDINKVSEEGRCALFKSWGGVCNCGGDGRWCCFDPRED